MSCIICLFRVLSCTFTSNACCSLCLWLMALVLMIGVASMSLYISLYIVGFVALILYTMLLFTENSIVQIYQTYSCREVGRTMWQRLHRCGIQPCIYRPCIYVYTCILHKVYCSLCHLCSLCKRRNIRRPTIHPAHPTIIIIESCDNTLALGVKIQPADDMV
jgi:hypothetical protein